MPISGFAQKALFVGTINDEETFPDSPPTSTSMQLNFSASDVWSCPFPQRVDINSDEARFDLWVSSYTDKSGVHTGKFFGIFGKGCTNVGFAMFTKDCIARIVMNAEFFD
jgi:hypothetical protein